MSYLNNKKKKTYTKLYSWLIIFVLFVIVLFLTKNVYGVLQGERKSQLNREQSEAILRELEEKRDSISSEIEYLKTEKGVETELRDKFRIVKQGEEMAVIINPENEDKDLYINEKQGFFIKIKDFFGDLIKK
ncbi:hypothetical protein KKH36_01415 [Patescibacteria group bacterium]|nr:hypothetical protein [Patescibacteria group bacterium]